MQTIVRNPKVEGQKTACVCRYGAWGDAVLCSPVFRRLKADGYYVVFNSTERCYDILKHDPNIDSFLIQETNEIPNKDLLTHWKSMSDQYDRFINLNGSIEEKLLAVPWQAEYKAPQYIRHELFNKNYMDHTMAVAGFPDAKGELPGLFFNKKEEEWVKKIRASYPGFLVVYCLSGSSHHKVYPYADTVVQSIVNNLPDAVVLLVGEAGAYGIIDPHPQIVDLCGKIGIRKSFILCKQADLVITTETSVANAASAFDTPKIVLLSHSSDENLTKYWKNCFPIVPPAKCHPCHQIHYARASCPLEEETKMPVCVALLHPKMILEKVGVVYEHFKGLNSQLVHSVDRPIS